MYNTTEYTTMNILTPNEINNLIYALIKYGFGGIKEELKRPSNLLIKKIMFELMDNEISLYNIVDQTIVIVSTHHSVFLSDSDMDRLKRHCLRVADEFMKYPFEVRSDLGSDAEKFVTIH